MNWENERLRQKLKEKSLIFTGLSKVALRGFVKTEEKSVVSSKVPCGTKDDSILLTWCPECKKMAPYRCESRDAMQFYICEWCGGNMGDIYLTRCWGRAPKGTIVVRDVERIS